MMSNFIRSQSTQGIFTSELRPTRIVFASGTEQNLAAGLFFLEASGAPDSGRDETDGCFVVDPERVGGSFLVWRIFRRGRQIPSPLVAERPLNAAFSNDCLHGVSGVPPRRDRRENVRSRGDKGAKRRF